MVDIFDEPVTSNNKTNVMTEEFDLSDEVLEGIPKLVITIYGEKGHGKTAIAMAPALNGDKVAVISYDRKSMATKFNVYSNIDNIKVWDGVKYYSREARNITQSAVVTYKYIMKLLETKFAGFNPDWIVHDGMERLHEICEMKMRYENDLGPVQGFANKNLWKERRYNLNEIHLRSMDAANKGVIYTTYYDMLETRRDGEVVDRRKVPKWIDAIMQETDIVIEALQEDDKFYMKVASSKFDQIFKTGAVIDVTDNLIEAFKGVKI